MINIGLPFLVKRINTQIHKTKTFRMKKFLVVLALGSLVACNSGTSTEEKLDSSADATKEKIDSSTEAKIDAIDSSAEAKKAMVDSTTKAATDTTKH
jgi:maltose-binding protein MalE